MAGARSTWWLFATVRAAPEPLSGTRLGRTCAHQGMRAGDEVVDTHDVDRFAIVKRSSNMEVAQMPTDNELRREVRA